MDVYHSHISQLGALAFVSALTGCGNIATMQSFSTPYQEPSGSDLAQLRVFTNGIVRAVPGQSCINWRSAGAGVMVAAQKGFANLNNHDLQMPKRLAENNFSVTGNSKFARSELKITANAPITLNFISIGYLSGVNKYACHKSLFFIPKSGENYEAVFLERGSQCLTEVRAVSSTKNSQISDFIETKNATFCNASDNF